ncbi:MAG: hypothetical protein ABF672_11325 [Gluconobacter oxydans]
MSFSSEQHRALGTFLRARRDTLSPEDVGLHPLPGRRRAKGLRREEAAQVAARERVEIDAPELGPEVHLDDEIERLKF